MFSSFRSLFNSNAINKAMLDSISSNRYYFFCNDNSHKQEAILGSQYILKRIDDNGNTFEVGLYKTKSEAEQRIHEFTINQHKQHYWIEEISKLQTKSIPCENKIKK